MGQNPVGMVNIVAVDFNPRLSISPVFIEFRRNGAYKWRLNVPFLRNSIKVLRYSSADFNPPLQDEPSLRDFEQKKDVQRNAVPL